MTIDRYFIRMVADTFSVAESAFGELQCCVVLDGVHCGSSKALRRLANER